MQFWLSISMVKNSRKHRIATALTFGGMQSSQWWHAVHCYDCALKYGFPFRFRQTEGYAKGG